MVNRWSPIAAVLLTACSIPDVTFTQALPADGSAGSGAVQHTVTARWSLKHFTTGAVIGCPPSGDVARVAAEPWNPVTQQPAGAVVAQEFACTAGMGAFQLPSDLYLMGVSIRTTAGQTLMNSAVFVANVTRDGQLDVILYDDAGYVAFNWDIVNKATQMRISCATARLTASDAIEMIETDLATGTSAGDDYLCDDHFGTTVAMLPGHYKIQVAAVNNSAVVSDVATFADVQVVARDVTDVGSVKIFVPVP
jgi:hypothetical protein